MTPEKIQSYIATPMSPETLQEYRDDIKKEITDILMVREFESDDEIAYRIIQELEDNLMLHYSPKPRS